MGLIGSLTRTLFGGSKETSESGNQFADQLNSQLSGNIGLGNSAMTTLGSLLGIGDPAAGQKSLNNFLDSTGYQFMLDEGLKGITGNMAARGLLRSGSAGKAFLGYNQELAKTKLNELIQNLTSLGNYGLGSAGVVAGAGQYSKGKGTSTGGLFPNGLSDRRLKNIIEHIGHTVEKVPVYRFEYRSYPGVEYIGVIAQEVREVYPEALGPYKDGYLTVKYDKLEQGASLPPFGRVREDA